MCYNSLMKKKRICLYYSILMLFCQCFTGVGVGTVLALEGGQKASIVDHCDEIKDSLKNVQRKDRQTRVYLGRIYETVLSKFITPLNLRLVENNLSNQDLLTNQSAFAERRSNFVNDYISYQQALEEVLLIDCKAEPEKFFDSLEVARGKRKTVNRDVVKLRALMTEQIKVVTKLKESL